MIHKNQAALSLGYSPCPNDTFIFCGLTEGHVPLGPLCFAPPLLEDVETLNSWAMQGRLDVTKLSFHALGHLLDRYTLLDSGAALGRGCGPLLVTKQASGDPASWTVAIPGTLTTAALLLRLFLGHSCRVVVMRFEKIIAAVLAGEVDAGLIIHESRFTYQERGLHCVQDLGSWWEEETGLPIPLGCIAARRSLAPELRAAVEQAIAESICWARAQLPACMGSIRQHAHELDEAVIAAHIKLYVNDFSLSLGAEGHAAVQELLYRGQKAGVFPAPARLIS